MDSSTSDPSTEPESGRLRAEWDRALRVLRSLDLQTVVVLCSAAILVILQQHYGSRQLFREVFGSRVPAEWRGLLAWGWWFGMQGILGFLVPVLILMGWKRRSLQEIGLGLGDWRLASTLAVLYIPLVVIGTWVLSDQASFQGQYPHFRPAVFNWQFFVLYELLFLFYWIGWEYLWRGFVLFGTAPTFGPYAIFIQAVPFAILHMNKPLPEAILSIFGGIALGALVWRCRSFWIAVPIHATQMLALDAWCTMRLRSGTSGIGLDALRQVIGGGP